MTKQQALLAVCFLASTEAEKTEDAREAIRLRNLADRLYRDAKGTDREWRAVVKWMGDGK